MSTIADLTASTSWVQEQALQYAWPAAQALAYQSTYLGALAYLKVSHLKMAYEGVVIAATVARAGYPLFSYLAARPKVALAVGCTTVGIGGICALKARKWMKDNYTRIAITGVVLRTGYRIFSEGNPKVQAPLAIVSCSLGLAEILFYKMFR